MSARKDKLKEPERPAVVDLVVNEDPVQSSRAKSSLPPLQVVTKKYTMQFAGALKDLSVIKLFK
jgi:hypothetical protein